MVLTTTPSNVEHLNERTIGAVLRRQLGERPDQLAVRDRAESLTYAELYREALQLATGLQLLGLNKGDPVLLMLDNHVDYVRSWIGLGLTGSVEVPVNTAYRGNILNHVVNDSNSALMIVEEAYLDRVIAQQSHLTNLKHIVVRTTSTDLPSVPGWQISRFDELAQDEPAEPAELHSQDLLGIMYTSGTTGPSKGVLASHGLAYSYSSAVWAGENDVIMCNLPLFHIGGQWAAVYAALIQGGTCVVLPRFSATTFWSDVDTFNCTQTLLLGAMASFLQAQPPSDRDRDHALRHVNMVPVLPNHEEFSARFNLSLGSAYGLTEFSSPLLVPYGKAEPGLAGWPRDDFELRIVDENDMDVPPGSTGELVGRPKVPWAMMSGYHGLPEKTSEAWRNLWFHTGDAMRQDELGRYHFVDRYDDALRVRGENVSSFEVEREILDHPAVMACAVVALPSEFTEDEIKAVVVRKSGAILTPETLLKHLVPRLPYFMVPRYFEFISELPTTPTQKIKKAELRNTGITDSTWDREANGYRLTKDGLTQPSTE